MNFLAPWFLAGVLLVGGPIIAHLIRQATRNRVSFSAMRFLSPSPPVLNRRNRIQYPWLLALRCLVIAALAMCFARPFFRYELPGITTPGIPQHIVAVLDQSASMQRAGLWDAAKKKVSDLAAGLGPDDQFVLLGVSSGVTELISHDQWKQTPVDNRAALVHTVLDGLKPGWGAKRLDAGIENAVGQWEQMTEKSIETAHKKIVVISDFTNSARVAGLAGLAWPKGGEVNLEPVTAAATGNAGVQWLGWTTDNPKDLLATRVRVSLAKENPASSLQLQLRDASTGQALSPPQIVKVAPGDAQMALVPIPKEDAEKPLSIVLQGDQEPFDNTVWAVRTPPRELSLGYYGAYDPKAPDAIHHARFYLELAVAGWKDPIVNVRTGDTAADAGAPAKPGTEVMVVADPLQPAAITSLRARLDAGAFAIVLLNSPEMVGTAAALAGETDWKPSTPGHGDALLGQIDFQHPLFSLFAEPRYSDFTHIRFWHPQSITLPAKTAAVVAARFDDGAAGSPGSPAVIEAPVGKGRLVVWGGDWEPSTDKGSQWVLSTKFVPWLQAFFERAAGGALRPNIGVVGDASLITGSSGTLWRALTDPAGVFKDTVPEQPGVYQIQQDGANRWVALEVPPEMSDLTPLPLETWEKLGVPMHADAVTSVSPLPPPLGQDQTSVTFESRQKLWRWLLVAAAVLLAFESIYSLAISRRAMSTSNEAPSL